MGKFRLLTQRMMQKLSFNWNEGLGGSNPSVGSINIYGATQPGLAASSFRSLRMGSVEFQGLTLICSGVKGKKAKGERKAS
jgi:hypothetical protein